MEDLAEGFCGIEGRDQEERLCRHAPMFCHKLGEDARGARFWLHRASRGFWNAPRVLYQKRVDPKNPDNAPFGDDFRLEFARRAKKQIRARMKALRQSYPLRALAQRSLEICERVQALQVFQEARSVALFWPMLERGEVDLRPILGVCLKRSIRVYFPFMDRKAEGRIITGFREIYSESELLVRDQKFHEPPSERDAARPGDVDLVLVPALAADTRGHRIGYGAGYYDATLGDVAPPAKVAIVAYHFQMLAELPTEAHDVAANIVITEKQVWHVE
jgi:5-formyltetrahydrofolate cyclo-ligase